MSQPTMDAKLAYSIGLDAGNRSMRAAKRTTWSREDLDAAIAAQRACYPAGYDEESRS